MGFFRRMTRKLKRDERYINMIGRTFWPCLILSIGWWMLWVADTRFSGFRKEPIQVRDTIINDIDTCKETSVENSQTIREDTIKKDSVSN